MSRYNNYFRFKCNINVSIGLLLLYTVTSASVDNTLVIKDNQVEINVRKTSSRDKNSSIVKSSSIGSYSRRESVTEKFIKGKLDSCTGLETETEERYYRKGFNLGVELRKREINSYLLSISDVLDRIFPITDLYLDKIIRPAIVKDISSRIDQNSGKGLLFFQKKYRIVEPDRIEKPKSWVDYLILQENSSYLNSPDIDLDGNIVRVTVKIENENSCRERLETVAVSALKEGFSEAIESIDSLYRVKMDKLYKDLTSLLLYHDLLYRKIIKPVRISAIHDDIIVDRDRREMIIDSTIYKIIEYSHFNSIPSSWR